tara:strand:+ start:523 stop:681 length:159 start_codon:yes stop_codon:yes gene_type:complete
MDFVSYSDYVNELMQERRRESKNGFLENLNPSKEELEKLYAKYLQKNQDKAS